MQTYSDVYSLASAKGKYFIKKEGENPLFKAIC